MQGKQRLEKKTTKVLGDKKGRNSEEKKSQGGIDTPHKLRNNHCSVKQGQKLGGTVNI